MRDQDFIQIGKIYNEVAQKVIGFTPQLYHWTDERTNTFEALGSCILFAVDGRHYLITAAHCIVQNGQDVNFGILDYNGHLRKVKGVRVVKHGLEDKIDLGVVKLSDNTVQMLKEVHEFVTPKNAMFNIGISHESPYLIVGYPITKTTINIVRRTISKEPFVFITKSKTKKDYQRLNYNSESNIILGFNRRKSKFYDKHEMNMSPNPKGVSGGGLWFVQSSEKDGHKKIEYNLCGIMIEYLPKDNVMIATKTDELPALLHSLERYNANDGTFTPPHPLIN